MSHIIKELTVLPQVLRQEAPLLLQLKLKVLQPPARHQARPPLLPQVMAVPRHRAIALVLHRLTIATPMITVMSGTSVSGDFLSAMCRNSGWPQTMRDEKKWDSGKTPN